MANGIPALLGQVTNVVNDIALVAADALNILNLFAGPQWGIGLNGNFVLFPDSILSLDNRNEWKIPNYPMEQGSFESYNKVTMPYVNRVVMTKGGTVAQRSAFLSTLDIIANSTDLYDIVTPEVIYSGVNVTGYSMQRTATNGVGLLTVEVLFEEIRVTATAAFQNTAQPSGANPVSTGSVQAQPSTLFGPNAVSFQ